MFKSLGHLLATWAQKVLTVIGKVDATAPVVEGITAEIPVYGPLALTVEKTAYAILGEIAAVLTAGTDAAKAGLTTAGIDPKVAASVQDLLDKNPTITKLAAVAPKS